MVLYRDLGDRPFPEELWNFLCDTFCEPMMVRFGRFGSASFCIVIANGLFARLPFSVGDLWSPPLEAALAVRVCRFRITVPVNFRYWFIWRNYVALERWIGVNRLGYRAVNWPSLDRLRERVVQVFQRCCRVPVLDMSGYVTSLGNF